MITANQLKVYQDYKKIREAEHKEFMTGMADVKLLARQSDDSYQPEIQERRRAMKSIEIDDEVYSYLQSQAISFEEPTPNQVIRRLLGLEKRSTPKEPSIQTAHSSNGSKAPRADLRKLVQHGILREGQKLILNYKDMLSNDYEAEIVGNRLLYQGKTYKMSSLVADILDQEGCGIPSRSYRGPEYWYTSDGISIRQLWEQYLSSR